MDRGFQYDPLEDVYFDENGDAYIKNEFNPKDPTFINISNEIWQGTRNGEKHEINWSVFSHLPENMVTAAKEVLRGSLKKRSSFYIRKFNLAIKALDSIALTRNWDNWGSITINDWADIWSANSSQNRSSLRSIYTLLARKNLDGASKIIANELKRWKSREDLCLLKDVRTWDPEFGSLSSAEIEVLRQAINTPTQGESVNILAGRLIAGCILETFKRSSQISGIKHEQGLREIDGQFFLNIPGVKAQAGNVRYWQISKELAKEITVYSNIPEVARLQAKYNRLFVFDCKSLRDHGQIVSAEIKNSIKSFIKSRNITSPRTNKLINVTPNRLRHTGGTKLAEHGFPRDVIAEILEHDSYGSADAYIDAIGSDLIPAIEKSDRKLGTLFSEISEIFFKGKVVDKKEIDNHPPVIIPIIEDAPALVGACGRDSIREGKCSRHPFMGCYDSCPSFLAWKDADHTKSLHYVESEFKRWDQAGGHKDRWKAKAEFERVYKAITEVITQVEGRCP